MSILRIIHTADNHLGLKFGSYNSPAKETLIAERFNALSNVVEIANAKSAHFIVVAGDLFDDIKVTQRDIKSCIDIFKKADSEVLILPGNHDYYDSGSNKLWNYFIEATENTQIKLLYRTEIYTTEVDGELIHFYPAPCMSKHHEGHVIGWVKDISKDSNQHHIGIAHGNVEGLGVDDADRYFNMKEGDLKNAGVDFWLLGHIHVPFPSPNFVGNPLFFMPATHTPESIKRKIPGYVWLIDIHPQKKLKFEQLTTGNVIFQRETITFGRQYKLDDFLQNELLWQSKQKILDLKLFGSLPTDDLIALSEHLKTLEGFYLNFSFNNTVGISVDKAFIQQSFAESTIAYKWLSAIAQENDSELALQMAYALLNPTSEQ